MEDSVSVCLVLVEFEELAVSAGDRLRWKMEPGCIVIVLLLDVI